MNNGQEFRHEHAILNTTYLTCLPVGTIGSTHVLGSRKVKINLDPNHLTRYTCPVFHSHHYRFSPVAIVVVVVVNSSPYYNQDNPVRGHRTGSNNSGVE